jgi:hypothetical protein
MYVVNNASECTCLVSWTRCSCIRKIIIARCFFVGGRVNFAHVWIILNVETSSLFVVVSPPLGKTQNTHSLIVVRIWDYNIIAVLESARSKMLNWISLDRNCNSCVCRLYPLLCWKKNYVCLPLPISCNHTNSTPPPPCPARESIV